MVTAFAFATSNAGFDWVTLLDDGQTVYASVSEDGCSTPIDLVFLLDSSGSIEDAGLGGVPGQFAAKELEFVKAVIGVGDMHTGPTTTPLAVCEETVLACCALTSLRASDDARASSVC